MGQNFLEMKKSTNSTREFFRLINLLIAGLWLFVAVETGLRWFLNEGYFPWRQIWDHYIFAATTTVFLLYFNRRFNTHILEIEEEHQKIFKKNPHPMWVYDLNTLRILIVNDAAISLYGYSEEEFLAMTIRDIRPDEDLPALISAAENIKLNFNLSYHWSGTWRHKKKNGEMMYVEISSHEFIFEGKKAELVLSYNVTEKIDQDLKLQALNRDLERNVIRRTNDLLQLNRKLVDQNKIIKSANLELYSLTKQLQEANEKNLEHAEMKNRFISMASHEFRTPLASINVAAGFVRRHYERIPGNDVLSRMQFIEKQVMHMTCLLDDVLTIGKADFEKMQVKIERLNLREFVDKVSEEARSSIGNSSHQVIRSINDDVPEFIDTNEKFLRNIFINLLTNAIKYSPGRDVVYLNIYRVGSTICFIVKDEGIGISPIEVAKIFEPFYRIDSTRNIPGTGLGLAIVKKAAALINASVTVESKLNEGSVFRVVLEV